jgi:hypothetical protein
MAGEDYHFVAHLQIRNDLTGRPLNVDRNFFSLDSAGSIRPAVAVPGQFISSVQPSATADFAVAFETDANLDFAATTLIVAQPGAEPARMPLAGTVPASGYPITIEIETGQNQVTSGNPCGTTMLVAPLGAEVDVDARIDGVGSKSAIEGNRRAATSERFVRLEIRATGNSGQCGGANVIDDLFRLQIDGVARGAVSNVNEVVSPGEAIDFEVLYRVPVGTTALVLLAGQPSGAVAEYRLTFSRLTP